ncbi:MAG: pyruvate dehydrogenase complex dihydrolipoamide acetyltransferase, partial [Pelagibacterales bacterium]|nr:pyruvate dehydrogenase complex dihydrolipoamide acetyltransferase [Pelagibacterales bacterium]
MAIPILMPALSPTMTEGSLAKWCKNVGDEVKPGDIIAEVETDKATMEIESVDEGVLEKILFNDGTEGIGVNSLIAILKSKNDTEQDIKDILDTHDSANNTMEIVINEVNDKEEVSEIVKKAPELNINPLNDAKVKEVIDNPVVSNELTSNNNLGIKITASPLAKRIALQNNIDLKNIIGSGPRGRIVKADLDNYFNKSINLNNKSNFTNKENIRKKTSSMRKIIAERLSFSKKEVPHFYLSIDCNVDNLIKSREEINKTFNKELKISVNDFIIKAMSTALFNVPEANCTWGKDEMVFFGSVDVSVAIAVEGGLFTPVIKNANYLNLRNISAQMKDYVIKANAGKLLPEDYEGGNFSISNLGMYGIDSFSAIINPPQSGILAVGSISKKPIVIDNEVKICNIMTCQLSG